MELFPGTKLGIGPAIENGFYYDFDCPHHFVPEDLTAIEEKMRAIVKQRQPFVCTEHKKDEALEKFSAAGEKYKAELIEGLPGDTVTYYTNGSFTDLCRGPHVGNTGEVRHFKITHIAGAYWRGDEKRPMTNVLMSDAVVLNKIDSAKKEDIKLVTENIKRLNPKCKIIEARSPVTLADKSVSLKGKKVLVVEDGPTLTHGEMKYGAAYVAAKAHGAKEIVSPIPYAAGSIKGVYKKYSHLVNILPAMRFSISATPPPTAVELKKRIFLPFSRSESSASSSAADWPMKGI